MAEIKITRRMKNLFLKKFEEFTDPILQNLN